MLLRKSFVAALIIGASWCIGATSASAAALLVAVDEYTDGAVPDLPAVARDAEDLAAALKTAFGEAPVVLTGARATKPEIFSTFRKLVAASRPNEVLVFAFAGHGSQVQDQNQDEEDALDEVLLLSGVSLGRPSVDQMILDDEIDALIRYAAPRPVVVIVDSSHSEGAIRSMDPRISPSASRSQPLDAPVRGLGQIQFSAPPEVNPRAAFLWGTHEAFRIGDVLLNGERRGALSWATARGLEGAADTGDGMLTVGELADYVTQIVVAISDGRQMPVTEIPTELRDLILTHYFSSKVEVKLDAPLVHTPLPVALRGSEGIPPGFDGLNAVIVSPHAAELTLDVDTGEVITFSGDIAVDLTPDWTVTEFGAVVEKYGLLRLLRHNTDGQIVASLSDGPRKYHDGETLRVVIESDVAGYLLLFALLADGTVAQIGSEREPITIVESVSFPLRVGPPFGGDHIVAVISSDPSAAENWIQLAEGSPLDAEKIVSFENVVAASSVVPISIYTARQ